MAEFFYILRLSDEEQIRGGCRTKQIKGLFEEHEGNVKRGHAKLKKELEKDLVKYIEKRLLF